MRRTGDSSSTSHNLTAAYSGDINNAPSTLAAAPVTVATDSGGNGDIPTLPEWGLVLLGMKVLMQGWRRVVR